MLVKYVLLEEKLRVYSLAQDKQVLQELALKGTFLFYEATTQQVFFFFLISPGKLGWM